MYKKTIFILLLFTILITSCRGKKEVSCPSFDPVIKEEKKHPNQKLMYGFNHRYHDSVIEAMNFGLKPFMNYISCINIRIFNH